MIAAEFPPVTVPVMPSGVEHIDAEFPTCPRCEINEVSTDDILCRPCRAELNKETAPAGRFVGTSPDEDGKILK